MTFESKLLKRQRTSLLCVGLDTLVERIPHSLHSGDAIFEFNKRIIDATGDLVCAYKPNLAFYLAEGTKGIEALTRTIEYIPGDIPVICDAKVCDVSHTARAYAKAAFETLNFDAITLTPYLGRDGIQPFLEYKDKGIFIVCRTSNKSALDFQHLRSEGAELYQIVARKAVEWNENGNIGLVGGAIFPEALKEIRKIVGEEMQILIPGIGAQCGDLECAVKFGTNSKAERAIINSSRAIIYAGEGNDFDQAARKAAVALKIDIDRIRSGKRRASSNL